MPKVSVYLPDDLYQRAREEGISLSSVTQEALRRTLDRARVDAWVERTARRPDRTDATIDTSDLLQAVRDEFGT